VAVFERILSASSAPDGSHQEPPNPEMAPLTMGLSGYAFFSLIVRETRESKKNPTERLDFFSFKLNAASLAAHVLN
jgi:hypothetical protein